MHANSAPPQAVAKLTPEQLAGDWHFCRGALDCDDEWFRTYEEIDAGEGAGAREGQHQANLPSDGRTLVQGVGALGGRHA
jgi:hypothetical protein